jgi:hypothetical protein
VAKRRRVAQQLRPLELRPLKTAVDLVAEAVGSEDRALNDITSMLRSGEVQGATRLPTDTLAVPRKPSFWGGWEFGCRGATSEDCCT